MALNIPEGFCEAAWIFDAPYGTPPFITTLGLNYGENDPVPALTDVANKCVKAWGAWVGIQEVNCQLQRVQVTVGDGAGGYGSVDSGLTPPLSTGSGAHLSPNSPLIIRKATSLLGRQGRGRMFIPMVIPESVSGTSGLIDPTWLEDEANGRLGTFLQTLVDPEDEDYPFVLGPALLHTVGSLHEDPTVITFMGPSPKVGTMRKRLR